VEENGRITPLIDVNVALEPSFNPLVTIEAAKARSAALDQRANGGRTYQGAIPPTVRFELRVYTYNAISENWQVGRTLKLHIGPMIMRGLGDF
jgi:hypothetical protein